MYKPVLDRLLREKKREQFDKLFSERDFEFGLIDQEIQSRTSTRLLLEAMKFDVKIPSFKEIQFWELNQGPIRLSSEGRFHLRRLIDEEKSLRFDVNARWVKLLIPLITALAGLLGVIIGLISVSRR